MQLTNSSLANSYVLDRRSRRGVDEDGASILDAGGCGGGAGRDGEVPDDKRGGERGAEPQWEEVCDLGEEGGLQGERGAQEEEE